MILYHATRSEFSEFKLNYGYNQGVNGMAHVNDFGEGIYLFAQEEDADYLVSNFHRKFQYDSEKQLRYAQENSVSHIDYSPFLQAVKSPKDCAVLGPVSFIFVNGWIVTRRDYESHLHHDKHMDYTAVRQALTKCILSKHPLTVTELSDYLRETNAHLSQEQIAPVAAHFAGKEIIEKLLAVPFKGRVLRVALDDDAKILDDRKTIAENNAVYDLDKVCDTIYPKRKEEPLAFMEKVGDLYWLADFHCWRDHSHEIRSLFQQTRTDLIRILKTYETAERSDVSFDTIKTKKILTLTQKAVKTLLDHSTFHAIRTLSQKGCGHSDALLNHFEYDGVLLRNLDPYDADAYCIKNLKKLTIDSYKPYGSDKWIPMIQTPLAARQTLPCKTMD